jgi:hypothetical protein
MACRESTSHIQTGLILKQDFAGLNKDRLYRNMDRLYGKARPD